MLECSVEAFDDRDGAVLADRAEPWLDAVALTPRLCEVRAVELLALVRDDVLRLDAGDLEGPLEEILDLPGCGRAFEDCKAHGLPREHVHRSCDPPAEGPYLRKGERQERRPEASPDGNSREWHDSYVLSGFLAFDEKRDPIRGAEGGDPTRIVVEIEGGVVTAVTCDEAAEVHVADYDSIDDADAEWLDRFAGSYSDADGVGYDAVDEALSRAAQAIEEQRRRLADADA